ncbi:MAG: ABC transporter permease [Oscillospiraceae bacterium]|nr:ABC transporter permease [Oscillospiraceae bacterium]
MININNRTKGILKKREFSIFLILVVMMVISAIISPTFRSANNIANVFNQNAMYGLMAIGMSFVLIGGGMDLSVGSTSALAGMVAAIMMRDHGFVQGVIAAVSVGVLVGLLNGLLVIYLKLPSFIVTLGTMYIARGVCLILTNAHPVSGFPSWVVTLGIGKVYGIPVAAAIWVVLALIMQWVISHTKLGQYVYALGGNEKAAWLSGINTNKIRILTYIINGFFASLAGLIIVYRLMIATGDANEGYEMIAIAACVIGGISMSGGRGSIVGSIFGALIYGLIVNMLQLLGVSGFWQKAVLGAIIIIVASIDSLSNAQKK